MGAVMSDADQGARSGGWIGWDNGMVYGTALGKH